MKRTPLKPGTKRLQRSPMRRRPRKARPGDDRRYLAFVRGLPCCVPGTPRGCFWGVEAHHLTGQGMALKADDRQTMPLCGAHHDDLHGFKGPFAGMTRAQRRAWQLAAIEATQALWRAREGAA